MVLEVTITWLAAKLRGEADCTWVRLCCTGLYYYAKNSGVQIDWVFADSSAGGPLRRMRSIA